jgi:cell division septal protein FtsQ
VTRRANTIEQPHAPTSRDVTQGATPRRSGARRVVKWVVVTGVVASTLAVGAQWALRQSYFRVQHVTFVGLRHESAAAVLSASGLALHPSMIGLNEAAITARLARFPWINTVTITKHWPHSVVVDVHESVAVAVAFDGHVLDFVSRAGRALGPAPLRANLPTLEYVTANTSTGANATTTWPFAHAGRAAAYVASQLPPAFAPQVSIITDDAENSVMLKLTTPVTFVLGPPTDLHAKFVAIASVIAHSTLVPGDVVDVTVPDELAVTAPSS